MDELHEKLRILEKMTHELNRICGLVYVLKDAIWQNEEYLSVYYTIASFYISDQLNDFDGRLEGLLEDLFSVYRKLPKTA